jgi:hypothetical protein
MKNRLLTLLPVLLIILTPGPANSTEVLSNPELDEVSAQGLTGLTIDTNTPTGVPTLNFSFSAGGGTYGNGSAMIQPGLGTTTINAAGGLSFSNNLMNIQNLILNMNLCVQCSATTLTQSNLGVPITFNNH